MAGACMEGTMASGKDEDIKLSAAQLKKITEVAAQAACEAYRKEEESASRRGADRRLYNTRLLMERYRGLVRYSQSAVYDASQTSEDEGLQEILSLMSIDRGKGTLTVDSIRERAAKTEIIIQHMNRMLDYYKESCKKSGKPEVERKWETIRWMYLEEDEKNAAELAEMFYVDESTVYRYNRAALQDLSTLFFGFIDG